MKDIQISIFSMQDIGYDREGILTKTTGTYSFENGYHEVHYCELDDTELLLIIHCYFQMKKWN